MGRKILLLIACFAGLVSCGLSEVGGSSVDGDADDIWVGPGSVVVDNDAKPGAGKKVWYAVGVDYPQGYDWRTDDEKGSVRCSLVVFANGVPLMKVPAGDEYEVSADPDMHRVIRGSLYTDYSTETETVVKRNGEQLFRYPGREMIVEVIEDDDMVYTLGQSRDGNGFSFRVNGEVLLSRSKGYVFHHLQQVDDGFSFAFHETIGSGENAKECYYHYLAGDVCQVAVREDIKKVWDIVYQNDRICYLASLVGVSEPVLAVGEDLNPLTVPDEAVVKTCRFVSGSQYLDVEGVMTRRRLHPFSGLWNGCDVIEVFSPGYTVASACLCNGSVSCVLNSSIRGVAGKIYRCGELYDMPDKYMSMGGRSMLMVDGLLYVGLTSETDGYPAVWVENEMKPLKINGFISHISAD